MIEMIHLMGKPTYEHGIFTAAADSAEVVIMLTMHIMDVLYKVMGHA